jgi:hypothetical protein
MRGLFRHTRESWTGAVRIVHHRLSVLCLRSVTPAVQYRPVAMSFQYYMYSHCLHEDLTPKTTQTGCTSVEITGVGRQGRLVSEARLCTIDTQKAYGWSLRRAPFLLACSFAFQLSVFGKMLYWLLPPPYKSSRASRCFPLLPMSINAVQLLKFRAYR